MDKNKRILLVEDDENTRELYADILKSGGYDVQTAVDGQDGLEKCKNDNFSFILLDIMMPKVDGLQFLTSFKRVNDKSKIIIFTNLSHPSIINEAKRLGADDFIVKSGISPDLLLDKIKKML